jgi:hypothetical protein
MLNTLMVAPLGGDDGDPGAPTTIVEDVDGEPPRRRCRELGVPTIYVKDVDGGPPGRR